MDKASHRMQEVQDPKELADGRFHAFECHCPARDMSQQLIRIHPKWFVN